MSLREPKARGNLLLQFAVLRCVHNFTVIQRQQLFPGIIFAYGYHQRYIGAFAGIHIAVAPDARNHFRKQFGLFINVFIALQLRVFLIAGFAHQCIVDRVKDKDQTI